MNLEQRPWIEKARTARRIVETEIRKGTTKLEAIEIAAKEVSLGFSSLRNYLHAYEFIESLSLDSHYMIYDHTREDNIRHLLSNQSVFFVNTISALWEDYSRECILFLEKGNFGDSQVKTFAQRHRNPLNRAKYPLFLESLQKYFIGENGNSRQIDDLVDGKNRASAALRVHPATGQFWPGIGVTWLIERNLNDAELGRSPALLALIEFNEQRVADSYTRSAKTLFARAVLASCYADLVVVMAPVDLALEKTAAQWPTRFAVPETDEPSYLSSIPAVLEGTPNRTHWKLRGCTGVILLTTKEKFLWDLVEAEREFPNLLDEIRPLFQREIG